MLRDGGTAHLRPISPQDADAVQRFHMAQSKASVYLRFFTYKSSLTPKELARFTEVDYRNRVALVAVHGVDIIGIGRYDRLDTPTVAEVAFNISDHHQGRGLGSILLEHLAAAARENGIREFSAEVLPENRKMLQVFADAGYEVKRHFDDGVVSLSFDIDPTAKSRAVMESREHRAEARSVAGLLAPRSVAVIGASRRWGSVGNQLLEHLIEGGFAGTVYAVNPEALELGGMLTYESVAEIPEQVDLAIIAVPYDETAAVVEQCGAAGVKGVVVATAGYADDANDGPARQRELVRTARANGMRVVGPASLGIVNTLPSVSLNASLAPSMPIRGGLGLFSQSAAIGVSLYSAATRRHVGLSSALSAGNRADVSGNDLMQYWEDDPATTVCGMYLETFGNPRKFSRIARRLARSKPVIVARSPKLGQHLPPGHAVRTTAAPDGSVDAMMRQAGVIAVESVEDLMDVGQLLTHAALPKGRSVALFSNSLAMGRVLTDLAEAKGLVVGSMTANLQLDFGQSVALPLLHRTVLETLQRQELDSAVVTLMPVRGLSVAAIAGVLSECAYEAGKPIVAAFTGIVDQRITYDGVIGGSEDRPGLPCYANVTSAMAALAAATDYAQWLERPVDTFAQPEGIRTEEAEAQLQQWLDDVPGDELLRLTPDQVSRLLSFYEISVCESVPFESADAAVAGAERLGWPVALKTLDPTLRHRLDLGGVRLNILDAQSLRRNITLMRNLLAPYGEFGMEVQAMAPVGQSCVMRGIEDALLGPVVSFGLAGDAVNLLDDWAHRVPPMTPGDVDEMVRSPRAARKLFGYQGLPAVDIAAVERTLARFSALKDLHPEIALIELNPVLVGREGLSILAAEVHIGNAAQRTDSARRALLA